MYEANVTALPVHTRAKNNPLFTPIRHAFSVGSFTNYVGKFLAFFDHLPHILNLYLINITLK